VCAPVPCRSIRLRRLAAAVRIALDDKDIRAHALMTDAVHEHGALAGIELWHGGACTLNRTSRLAPLSPSGMPWLSTHLGFMGNLRPRAMDATDIRDLLKWQAAGARRAMQAGFDIVYVYAGMGYLPYEFLLPEYNHRTDAYGGSIENRVRLVRDCSRSRATPSATGAASPYGSVWKNSEANGRRCTVGST